MSDRKTAVRIANHFAYLQVLWDDPQIVSIFEPLGITPRGQGYMALRLAPVGEIPLEVAASLLGSFPRAMVEKLLGRVDAPAADVLAAGIDGLTKAAENAWGDHPAADELADLLEEAAAGAELDQRVLTSAWATVPWSGAPARLFGAATVLREHRGDGHWMAARVAGLTPAEMHVLARLSKGASVENLGHGFRPHQAEPIISRLAERGLVSGAEVTDRGLSLLEAIEAKTDELDSAPWDRLGSAGIDRVVELGSPFLD
jgi:hypothetical protein